MYITVATVYLPEHDIIVKVKIIEPMTAGDHILIVRLPKRVFYIIMPDDYVPGA